MVIDNYYKLVDDFYWKHAAFLLFTFVIQKRNVNYICIFFEMKIYVYQPPERNPLRTRSSIVKNDRVEYIKNDVGLRR